MLSLVAYNKHNRIEGLCSKLGAARLFGSVLGLFAAMLGEELDVQTVVLGF